MPKKDSGPATKEDIRLLMEQMCKYYDDTERRIGSLQTNMEAWKQEIIREFHVTAETTREDFRGIFKDRLEQHQDRLKRLERHAGLAPA